MTARLAGASPAERATLELVALAEPVGLRLLIELTDADAVERLERGGLIAARLPATLAAPDLFRLRFPKDAAILLERIDMPEDWPFGRAVNDLANAGRPDEFCAVAETLARLGFRLYAAEAYAPAAAAPAKPGAATARQRARAASEAVALSAACQARTPLLDHLGRIPILTSRERQIAKLAAAGHSNRDIAGRLHLSERTVEPTCTMRTRSLASRGARICPRRWPSRALAR